MTMTNSSVSPDDECQVCMETRENHGDKNHKFSVDGILEPKEPAPKARQQPPAFKGQESRAQRLGGDPTAALSLRLIERLVSKGVFNGDDLVYLFGGEDAPDRGPTGS